MTITPIKHNILIHSMHVYVMPGMQNQSLNQSLVLGV